MCVKGMSGVSMASGNSTESEGWDTEGQMPSSRSEEAEHLIN